MGKKSEDFLAKIEPQIQESHQTCRGGATTVPHSQFLSGDEDPHSNDGLQGPS